MPDIQRAIAFDFGLRRIGVAVGQTISQTATALDTLLANNGEPDWQQVERVIKEWQPDLLLVGIPLLMSGQTQGITSQARQFAEQLTCRFVLPVYGVDERLTTKSAREELFAQGGSRALRKKAIDSVAACLILEQWLTDPSASEQI